MIVGRSPCAGERPTGWSAHAFRGGVSEHRWGPAPPVVREPPAPPPRPSASPTPIGPVARHPRPRAAGDAPGPDRRDRRRRHGLRRDELDRDPVAGPPGPRGAVDALVRRADAGLRPHREGAARSLRARRAQCRRLPPDPRARARRDDDGRGPDVLGQRRLRRPGDGRGRDRDAPGRRARRLDDHPAARPGAAAAGRRRRSRRRPVRAQGEGDHPVGPPDPGLPRPDRQAADHHRVPEPGLLRARRLRHRGRGPDLLRHLEADRPVRPPRPRCSPPSPSRPRASTRTATP